MKEVIYIKRGLDTILLAAGLFTLTGAILCYNLVSLGGEDIQEAIAVSAGVSGYYLSDAAVSAIEEEAVIADAPVTELLPPIIQPD